LCCFLEHVWCQGGKLIQAFASFIAFTLLVNSQILDVWNLISIIISINFQCVMFGSPFNYVFSYVSCLECTTFMSTWYTIIHWNLIILRHHCLEFSARDAIDIIVHLLICN
jgi:hypothetical protein